MSLFQELKRRNVFRVGAAYAEPSRSVSQVTDVVGENHELPSHGNASSRLSNSADPVFGGAR